MQFKDKALERFSNGFGPPPRYVPAELRPALVRRIQMLRAAASPNDLRVPPGNRLERLQGDRLGQYSIRVSKQWRLCFKWVDGEAKEVEFCDYHS